MRIVRHTKYSAIFQLVIVKELYSTSTRPRLGAYRF